MAKKETAIIMRRDKSYGPPEAFRLSQQDAWRLARIWKETRGEIVTSDRRFLVDLYMDLEIWSASLESGFDGLLSAVYPRGGRRRKARERTRLA